jgi:ATP-dependent 26S proteasome regulatory subunit
MVPKLKNYLASSNPCLFMPTVEDVKAEKHIISTMVDLNFIDRELCIWKVTSGAQRYERGAWIKELVPSTKDRPIKDFIPALNHVAQNSKTIGVFYHIRGLLKEANVIQSIIDAAYIAKRNFSTIIFVGAYLDLPPELYNIVTYCDFPLPTKEEIEELYAKLMKEWEPHILFGKKNKKEKKKLISKAATSALGLDLFSAENAIALAVSLTEEPNYKIIQSQKEQHVKKSEVLECIDTDITLEDVGGFGSLKEWLDKRKTAFGDTAKEYGLNSPKGILLLGLPGTGKSHIGKSIASFLELPLLRLDISSVFSKFVGDSESKIRRALDVIEAIAPAVVLLDEADKAFAGMESSGKTDSGVTARVLSTLLTWRQETKSPVFMIFTANDPDMMPSMVYRKGRLDEIWAVELPTFEERQSIYKIHIERRKRDASNYDLALLSKNSENFTGAEIEATIEDALFNSFYEGVELENRHILKSISETNPQNNIESEDMVRIKEWMKNRARPVSNSEENLEDPVKKKTNLSLIRKD